MEEINGLKPIELQTVDGGSIVISSARRVHTTNLTDHGTWHDTSYYLQTDSGVELELDTFDLLNFESFRSEAAAKLFRVIDEPMVGMWPVTAAKLLLLVKVAPLEEVVKDEREKKDEQEELKKAA